MGKHVPFDMPFYAILYPFGKQCKVTKLLLISKITLCKSLLNLIYADS